MIPRKTSLLFHHRLRLTINVPACLADQGKWLAVNRLKMNQDKTDALLVSTKDSVNKQLISSIPLVVGGAHIFLSPGVLNLGFLFDSHLSM